MMGMKRTTIELDEERLQRAQQALGTTGVKATVDAALQEAIRRDAARRISEWLVEVGDDMRDPATIAARRR
jgi:Arc/MetJ family transcription regulator